MTGPPTSRRRSKLEPQPPIRQRTKSRPPSRLVSAAFLALRRTPRTPSRRGRSRAGARARAPRRAGRPRRTRRPPEPPKKAEEAPKAEPPAVETAESKYGEEEKAIRKAKKKLVMIETLEKRGPPYSAEEQEKA